MSQIHSPPSNISESKTPHGHSPQDETGVGHQGVQGIMGVSLIATETPEAQRRQLPTISKERWSSSVGEIAFEPDSFLNDVNENGGQGSILYLAYGSNLCEATFKGVRGIKPLAQLNVLVPELALTFDLPGIPYSEPCFANVRYRSQPRAQNSDMPSDLEKKSPSINGAPPEYHKDKWKKGLVGVVYEVSRKDYATIIATEGGNTSYKDVVVTCHPLLDVETVPEIPHTSPFDAHTLFCPDVSGFLAGRAHRPDPSYAQPSARYLKLITDGADEHGLPKEYKLYLHDIRPYTITTTRQRIGRFLFTSVWMPVILVMILLQRTFKDKRGRSPKWLIEVSRIIYSAMWVSYDRFFKGLFGDGERTIGAGRHNELP
ncbi:hypothetical protein GP486_004591 [Trichoglossum hirsutum]|uniref:gamma-glutamylcyclotransferase n=1 Tax=Trichoglossum hirsutum TaxID=265104 RepID=A0A9P8RNT7_9PEZI|nr:hypothetical protein GP486_004591 [Trichoglossum hirsutum]